jgi:hypothetical protein
VERTLELMHGWGYAPTIESLATGLIGGIAAPERIVNVAGAGGRLNLLDGFVCLRGQEGLVSRSNERVRTNHLVNGKARAVAEAFSRSLMRSCPFVDCVALSGSVASGGYIPTDDIDLDIIVRDGTKYLTYAISLLWAFVYALRYRDGGGFRKVICINVIWTRSQTRPFVRKDAPLAFELLRCKPLFGASQFNEVIAANPWLQVWFPQINLTESRDSPRPGLGLSGRFLARLVSNPGILAVAERLGRAASHAVYRTAHWIRRQDRGAVARFEFLQKAKYPYEFFQD